MTDDQLSLPEYRVKSTDKGREIFDPIRKKFVTLTPEESVRQVVIVFLLSRKRVPKTMISVEKELIVARTKKRYDIIVYNKRHEVGLIVECKAPTIRIDQGTFDQIARYNMVAAAQYIMVTNGDDNYTCTVDYKKGIYNFLEELPSYDSWV